MLRFALWLNKNRCTVCPVRLPSHVRLSSVRQRDITPLPLFYPLKIFSFNSRQNVFSVCDIE